MVFPEFRPFPLDIWKLKIWGGGRYCNLSLLHMQRKEQKIAVLLPFLPHFPKLLIQILNLAAVIPWYVHRDQGWEKTLVCFFKKKSSTIVLWWANLGRTGQSYCFIQVSPCIKWGWQCPLSGKEHSGMGGKPPRAQRRKCRGYIIPGPWVKRRPECQKRGTRNFLRSQMAWEQKDGGQSIQEVRFTGWVDLSSKDLSGCHYPPSTQFCFLPAPPTPSLFHPFPLWEKTQKKLHTSWRPWKHLSSLCVLCCFKSFTLSATDVHY